MPRHLKALRWFCIWTGSIFSLSAVFALVVMFFAPGPIVVNRSSMSIDEFEPLGWLLAGGSAVIAAILFSASIGIRRRGSWFRPVLMGLVLMVLYGGVVAQIIAGRLDLALASGLLAVPAAAGPWLYLYRTDQVSEYLQE